MARELPQQGFTLIEMMITIVVLGILMAIAVPSFTTLMDSIRLKRAGDGVNAFLVNAKSEAIKRNKTVRAIVKKSGGGTTWCVGMTEGTSCNCLATPNTCTMDGVDRTIASSSYKNVKMDDPDDGHAFVFSALRGTVTGNDTVELESLATGAKLNAVVSTIGRIRLCSPDGSTGGYPTC